MRAWRPGVPGVEEVLHAYFPDHAYPSHTHDTWTLLVIDSGAVRFDLGRSEHVTTRDLVTLLPPHVPHDGRGATPGGFRKRVLYLAGRHLRPSAHGHDLSIDPRGATRRCATSCDLLHLALSASERFEAENRLALRRGTRRRAPRADAPAGPRARPGAGLAAA